MEERKSIVEIVNNNPKLQEIISELVEKKFLFEGIFHPQAYLRNTDRIKTSWKRKKTKINAIAMGVSIFNDNFMELANSILLREDPKTSEVTKMALTAWEEEVKKIFPSDYEEIQDICLTIGQYLEFMNRKSQGF